MHPLSACTHTNTLGFISHLTYLGTYFGRHISITSLQRQTKVLVFIRQTLHMANWETKLVAHTALVCPQLEYASTIWNPHQAYLVQKLESIQIRATRFILKNYMHTSITTLKKQIGLRLLADRRKTARLVSLHALYYPCPSKRELYCPPGHHISRRTDHSQKLHSTTPRTNHFKFSPLQLSISDWNSRPENIVNIQESSGFRTALATFFNT